MAHPALQYIAKSDLSPAAKRALETTISAMIDGMTLQTGNVIALQAHNTKLQAAILALAAKLDAEGTLGGGYVIEANTELGIT